MSVEDLHRIAAGQARSNAERYLGEFYGIPDLRITAFKPEIGQAIWTAAKFSWPDIAQRDFGPVTLDIAVWIGARLEILALCTGHGPQVIVRFLEGRADGDARLKGQRLWAVLECAANFATGLGKRELWWHPESEEFLNFCLKTIGAKQRGRQCMFRIPT